MFLYLLLHAANLLHKIIQSIKLILLISICTDGSMCDFTYADEVVKSCQEVRKLQGDRECIHYVKWVPSFNKSEVSRLITWQHYLIMHTF